MQKNSSLLLTISQARQELVTQVQIALEVTQKETPDIGTADLQCLYSELYKMASNIFLGTGFPTLNQIRAYAKGKGCEEIKFYHPHPNIGFIYPDKTAGGGHITPWVFTDESLQADAEHMGLDGKHMGYPQSTMMCIHLMADVENRPALLVLYDILNTNKED